MPSTMNTERQPNAKISAVVIRPPSLPSRVKPQKTMILMLIRLRRGLDTWPMTLVMIQLRLGRRKISEGKIPVHAMLSVKQKAKGEQDVNFSSGLSHILGAQVFYPMELLAKDHCGYAQTFSVDNCWSYGGWSGLFHRINEHSYWTVESSFTDNIRVKVLGMFSDSK